MSYSFFTAEPLMVDGPGFARFGREHLIALALCLVAINGLVRFYLEASDEGVWSERRRTLATMAGTMVAVRFSHDLACLMTGTFTPPWWPLHLCNICELLCLVYVARPSESLGLAVAGLALPSGLLALAFPGWYYCPMLTWASICGFVGHANLVAFALSLILSGDVRPRLGNAWVPLAHLACYLAVIFPFNRAFDTNFAFINWPIAGTPLVAMEKAFGNPGYLAPYLALMVLIISGLFWLVDHVFED